jgi:hypothetical protein
LREARQRYDQYFSSARLRQLARRRRGDRHGDLWDAVQLVFGALGDEDGVPDLALPGIGGIFETALDDGRALPLDEPLAGARLSNEALLGAVRALSLVKPRDGSPWRRVDFGNLGAEELGSVYESLLELIPRYDAEQLSYTLETLAGNERKETGSYYTPTSLVECLLDSALDPLLDEACAHGTVDERVAALLGLTVCDPACGSGHFLVAAARRIAKRIAAEETGDPEPPDAVVRAALRCVTGRCIYGVDINPMAAELAKVSLWLEALEPGKPLSYLDQNIRVGNSLLGVTPALLTDGLPDEAFKPIEGDDRKVAAALKKQNAAECAGQHDLFSPAGIQVSNAALAKRAAAVTQTLPDSLEDLHIHQQRQAAELAESPEWRTRKLVADAWCAAFVQPKTEETRSTAITQSILEQFDSGANTLELSAVEDLVSDLTRQYRFFHWHVEFPHIFPTGNGATSIDPVTGWSGGFACVIGNPPWERVKLQEQEFFASRSPDIANAPNAAVRKKLIAALSDSTSPADQTLYSEFQAEQRKAAGWSHLLRESNRYPLTGHGDINTYAAFAETARTVIGPRGRLGMIVPTGIATDATTAPFFRDLITGHRLASLLDFVTNPRLWTDVGNRRYRFSILTIGGSRSRIEHAEFATLTKHPSELPPPAQRIRVAAEDLLLVNPNTGTCPMFQTSRDARITIDVYKRIPILWRDEPEDNPWDVSFLRMLDMANDSGLFYTSDKLKVDGWHLLGNVFVRGKERMLPLYEAKLVHHFDHRLASYDKRAVGSQDTELPRLDLDEKNDPSRSPIPRYWVDMVEIGKRLGRRGWDKNWLFGWRDIARSTDERTMICDVLPRTAVGHTYPLMLSGSRHPGCLYANLASFVLDYVARQKMAGTHLTYGYVMQWPVFPPRTYDEHAPWEFSNSLQLWIDSRVLELSYTAYDLASFAVGLGDNGPPFRWDEERRLAMRAELDAAFFHLYGIERDDVDYIMETFPIVRRKDEQRYGTYRTKELILEIYDAMTEAARTGKPYQTILNPPPGRGGRHG